MTGDVGTWFWDSPPEDKIYTLFPDFTMDEARYRTLLFATDGFGNLTGLANTYGKFSAAGATQTDLCYYVTFSLGEDEEACSKILGMGVDYAGKTIYYSDEQCTQRYYK